MGDYDKEKLRPVFFRVNKTCKVSFYHTKDSFDLPVLTIRFAVPVKLHFPVVFPLRHFVFEVSYLQRDNRPDVFGLPCMLMIGFHCHKSYHQFIVHTILPKKTSKVSLINVISCELELVA